MCADGTCSSNTDSAHCGSSCVVCSAGQTCANGACAGGGPTGAGGSTGAGGTGGGGTTDAGSTTDSGSSTGTVTQPALVTSAPGAYWNTSATWTAVANGTADVTVNDSQTAQTWEGFGGAFNELGWSYLSMLSPSDRDNAIQLLFGVNGAHFTMGRIPIGASDYALQRYTEDETANDTSLNNFSINQDMMYLIPYITAAMKVSPNMRFWASPWTPPTWMKTRTGTVAGASCGNVTGNGKTDTSVFDGGCMQDIDANLKALAQYFVKWIRAYGALDPKIVIDTLAPQNEPNYATGYPSALWTPALYTKFIGTYLAPALSAASLSTKIMLGTMSNGDNGSTSKDLMVVQAVMADATAKSLVKVMGLQWGMLDLYEGLVSGISKSNFMTGTLPVWATEHKCGNYPWNPTGTNTATGLQYMPYVEPAPNDQAYGVETWNYIRNAITKGGVTAYNAWNMVLDTVGKGNDAVRDWAQDSLLLVNTSSKTLILTPAYHVFRHFGQFVVPGAHVVATSGGDAVAFKNPDGSIISIIYNSGAAKTLTVSVGGKKLQFSMPASGWATVNYVP
jgi:glucosylceramidase